MRNSRESLEVGVILSLVFLASPSQRGSGELHYCFIHLQEAHGSHCILCQWPGVCATRGQTVNHLQPCGLKQHPWAIRAVKGKSGAPSPT